MIRMGLVMSGLLLGGGALAEPVRILADPPKECSFCTAWNKPHAPFQVYGNSYYVGTAGLSAILITSDEGHILLDGALPQSAPLIAENIAALGFDLRDVKIIANSHAHFDHAGGINALQKASGAEVIASRHGARTLARGNLLTDDPQTAFPAVWRVFPPIENTRAVANEETTVLGRIALTAHYTPGHTPGSTTWAWQSCEGDTCLDIVYADSLNAVSAPGYLFGGRTVQNRFRKSIEIVAGLPCDILLAPHPEFVEIPRKLAQRAIDPEINPFIDGQACTDYAAAGLDRLERRLVDERVD